jgi:hypothetical protein
MPEGKPGQGARQQPLTEMGRRDFKCSNPVSSSGTKGPGSFIIRQKMNPAPYSGWQAIAVTPGY